MVQVRGSTKHLSVARDMRYPDANLICGECRPQFLANSIRHWRACHDDCVIEHERPRVAAHLNSSEGINRQERKVRQEESKNSIATGEQSFVASLAV